MRTSGMDISPITRYDARTSTASTKSTDSDSDVHSLLRQYFDTAGDVMVLQGRLEDLDAERWERQSQRELLQDQGIPLLRTDEEFANEFSDRRNELQQSLETAQTAAEALRSKCETDGLDVETAKWRLPNPKTVTDTATHHAILISTTAHRSMANRTSGSASTPGPVPHQAYKTNVQHTALDLKTRFERLRPTASSIAEVDHLKRTQVSNVPIDTTSARTQTRLAGTILPPSTSVSPQKDRWNNNDSAQTTTLMSDQRSNISSASKSAPSLLPSSIIYGASVASASSMSLTSSSLSKRRIASLPDNGEALIQSTIGGISKSSTRHDYKRVRGTDLAGVHYDLEDGPPDDITDPELRKVYGVSARKRVAGTDGDAEVLDSSFHVPTRPQKFFSQGKVFAILWAEPDSGSDTIVTNITYKENVWQGIHAKVRKFVVIRSMESYCSAIPITTNNGQGVSMSGVKKSDFAVIHTSKAPPAILASERPARGEPPMRNMSIRVDPDNRELRLDPRSRLNFGKVYTIAYNVKVKNIGKVSRDSMRGLLYQFRDVWKPAFTPSHPANTSQPKTYIADMNENFSPLKPVRNHEEPDASTASNGDFQKGDRRPSQSSPPEVKASLANEASSAVGRLLSRGHSVDQILSALDGKGHNQDRIFDMHFSDNVY